MKGKGCWHTCHQKQQCTIKPLVQGPAYHGENTREEEVTKALSKCFDGHSTTYSAQSNWLRSCHQESQDAGLDGVQTCLCTMRSGQALLSKHVQAAETKLTCGNDGVGGQEGCQVALHADGAHAWATAPVGNTEGLVQVQVAHICSNDARGCQADLQAAGTWGCSTPCTELMPVHWTGRDYSEGDRYTSC